MNRSSFLQVWVDTIEAEAQIDENTNLESIEEWDSLAAVTTLALFKQKLGLNVSSFDIHKCKTVKDMLDLGLSQYE